MDCHRGRGLRTSDTSHMFFYKKVSFVWLFMLTSVALATPPTCTLQWPCFFPSLPDMLCKSQSYGSFLKHLFKSSFWEKTNKFVKNTLLSLGLPIIMLIIIRATAQVLNYRV